MCAADKAVITGTRPGSASRNGVVADGGSGARPSARTVIRILRHCLTRLARPRQSRLVVQLEGGLPDRYERLTPRWLSGWEQAYHPVHGSPTQALIIWRRTGMGDAAVKGPQAEIEEMEKGAERFLTDDANRGLLGEMENCSLTAVRDTDNSRKAFYILRTIALISAIAVPSLVGLNLSGTGGSVVRWLTFALSLITAIVTGIVTLYRLSNRWLMYRKIRDDLMAIGWTLVQGPALKAQGDQQAWASFLAATANSLANTTRLMRWPSFRQRSPARSQMRPHHARAWCPRSPNSSEYLRLVRCRAMCRGWLRGQLARYPGAPGAAGTPRPSWMPSRLASPADEPD